MRCPECQQRNSVAARKCKFCGAKFKRKEMSRGKLVILLLVLFGLLGLIFLAFSLPKMVDPLEQLSSVAKRVAAGPRSPEDAKEIRVAFDEAVKKVLLKHGSENSMTLSKRLKESLPSTAFEVLVVDLPKDLKLVEIDTVLHPSDFLVMKGTNDTRVIPLPSFEVYDDARAVSDQAGTVIVLLGHTGGQPPHRPLVHTYALLPDSVVDETQTMVPAIGGEGTAKFGKDSSDVNIELSLPSVAVAEKISINPPISADKILRMKLQWKEAKYVPSLDFPQDPHAIMLLFARCLKYPDYIGPVNAALGEQAAKLMKEHASVEIQDLKVQKRGESKKALLYTISTGKKKLDIELKKAGSSFQIAGYSVSAPLNVVEDATSAGSRNQQAGSNDAKTAVATDKNLLAKTSAADPLAGLTPEKAGRNAIDDAKTTNLTDAGNKPSSWLDDENTGKTVQAKPPVAVLPPALKNLPSDKDKKEKERKEREKLEREKQAAEKSAREKAARDNSSESTSASTGRIADYLGTSSVRMRSGPGLNNQTLQEIPKGTKIQILGQKNGWYKVNYAGKTGYVFAPLVDTGAGARAGAQNSTPVTASAPEKTAADAPSQASSGSVVVRRVMTVRDERRRAISSVKVGQHVTLLGGLNNNRYKIRMPDGTVGYVHKDALDVKVETPPEFVP